MSKKPRLPTLQNASRNDLPARVGGPDSLAAWMEAYFRLEVTTLESSQSVQRRDLDLFTEEGYGRYKIQESRSPAVPESKPAKEQKKPKVPESRSPAVPESKVQRVRTSAVAPGVDLRLEEYSEKSLVLRGDTKPHWLTIHAESLAAPRLPTSKVGNIGRSAAFRWSDARAQWTPRLSQAFKVALQKQLEEDGARRWNDRTVNRILPHLKTFAKWVHQHGAFPLGNPMSKVKAIATANLLGGKFNGRLFTPF